MKSKYKISFLIFFVILFTPLVALAWSGKCVAVHDGDTILVMHEGKAERIRLYVIDCPEKRQAFTNKAQGKPH